jgi:PUA domain protein
MPERYRRYFLKAKESKDLLDKASERFKVNFEQIFRNKAGVEVIETEFAEIFLINGKPVLSKTGENVYPTLVFKEFFDLSPKAVVDMGAVPYVCKGANVMAPGIKRFEGEFRKGDLVSVIDEKYGKPLAIGQVVYDAEEVKNVEKGIVVKNTHFVGDRLWNFLKELHPTA